jgi:hypothetical protein
LHISLLREKLSFLYLPCPIICLHPIVSRLSLNTSKTCPFRTRQYCCQWVKFLRLHCTNISSFETLSFEDMTNVKDGLEHLSSVRFDMNYFCDISSLFHLTNPWFVSNTRPRRMLNKNNYTFRYSLDCKIFLWI